MRNRLYRALPAPLLFLCFTLPTFPSDKVQVMLQGRSADALAQIVVNIGGTVTHHLPIINAVGARLTRYDLDQVLRSPEVYRHIDDLDLPDKPEEDPDSHKCKVRGHIELDFTAQGIRWKLYNKRADPGRLQALTLSWPASLGGISALSLGNQSVDPALYRDASAGSLAIQFDKADALLVARAEPLDIQFSNWPKQAETRPLQRDFGIQAEFEGDCATDLVPGYPNNDEDYYYNTVAGVDALHRAGITGRGVTVAVVDSGLWEHPALMRDTEGKTRVVARYDALRDVEGQTLVDESGHGTHMSSIIVNSSPTTVDRQPTGTFRGVAPDANLVAVKVLDRAGRAHLLDIVRAVQWVVDNRERYNIRVMNLSFAQLPRWPYWQDPVNQAVMRAWQAGITVVAAAGNEGPDEMTIGSPGNLPYIITVGLVTDSWTVDTRDDDYIPDFSSRGPTPTGHIKPEIVALGGHMTGLIEPNSDLAQTQPEDILASGEFVSTGSSQAAALVSGLLALLLQLEPELTPDDLKCMLISSAEPAINRDGRLAYSPFVQGYGQASLTRAITLGKRGCANVDMDIEAELADLDHFYGPALVDDDGKASLPDWEALVSSEPSAKGMSETRKWGIKDHIERPGYRSPPREHPKTGLLNWEQMYHQERSLIERLSRQAPDPQEP